VLQPSEPARLHVVHLPAGDDLGQPWSSPPLVFRQCGRV